MKKSLIATLILGSSLGLTSCGGSGSSTPVAKEETKSGVYSYEVAAWKTTYGMAVKVTFSKDKKITKVERDADKIKELGLVEVTQTTQGTWDGEAMLDVYNEKLSESLAKFNNVDANAYYTEAAAALGSINPSDKDSFPAKDSTFATKYYVNTGATQSNARLAAAVANACAELLGKTKLAVAQPSNGGDNNNNNSSTTPAPTSTAKPTTSATKPTSTAKPTTSTAKPTTSAPSTTSAATTSTPSTTPATTPNA